MPEDSIENVYGKGYRFKYPVEQQKEVTSTSLKTQKNQKFLFQIYLLPFFLIILLVGLWFFFKQEPKRDQLNAEERKSIHNLMLQDWNEGLLNIDQILNAKDQTFSDRDLAYLYSQKGVAEHQLQKMQDSFESSNNGLIPRSIVVEFII